MEVEVTSPTSIKLLPHTPRQIGSERRQQVQSRRHGLVDTTPSHRSSPPSFPSPSTPTHSAHTCRRRKRKESDKLMSPQPLVHHENDYDWVNKMWEIISARIPALSRIFPLLIASFYSPLSCTTSFKYKNRREILQCLHVGSGEFKGPLHRQRVERSHSLALYLQVQPGVEDKWTESTTLAVIVSVQWQGQRETVALFHSVVTVGLLAEAVRAPNRVSS